MFWLLVYQVAVDTLCKDTLDFYDNCRNCVFLLSMKNVLPRSFAFFNYQLIHICQ